jgi:hypothetical protein
MARMMILVELLDEGKHEFAAKAVTDAGKSHSRAARKIGRRSIIAFVWELTN